MQNLPFRDGAIDAAFAVECMCVVPNADRKDLLQELKRVLAPGGSFLSIDFFSGDQDYARTFLGELCEMSGLEIKDMVDLTEPAKRSIETMEHERSAQFERLPWFVRRSEFGEGLRETFCLVGTRRYNKWMNGERSYMLSHMTVKA